MWNWLRKRLGGDPRRKLAEALGGREPPCFDAIVMRALERLRDPNTPLSVVGEELEQDPGMSVRLLRVANSPAFATRHAVRNVPHAAALLGRSELESLLLSVAVRSASPQGTHGGLRCADFWALAARRAAIARELAARFHPASRSESFTAALLLDMAVPLLAEAQGAAYAEVLRGWFRGEGPLHELERARFGWDHPGVGAALAEHWRFPEPLAAAVGWHHDHEAADKVPPAVRVCSSLEQPPEEPEEALEQLAERAAAMLDQPLEAVRPVVREGWERGEQVAAAFV